MRGELLSQQHISPDLTMATRQTAPHYWETHSNISLWNVGKSWGEGLYVSESLCFSNFHNKGNASSDRTRKSRENPRREDVRAFSPRPAISWNICIFDAVFFPYLRIPSICHSLPSVITNPPLRINRNTLDTPPPAPTPLNASQRTFTQTTPWCILVGLNPDSNRALHKIAQRDRDPWIDWKSSCPLKGFKSSDRSTWKAFPSICHVSFFSIGNIIEDQSKCL